MAPAKIRSWPVMNAWMRGQAIDREPTMTPSYGEADLAQFGGRLYGIYCKNCHGAEGRGDGPRAPVFKPPPRDLTLGKYKFRSTPTGELPTSEDLFRTISGGLHGTGMPAFADLPELQRWALVAHLRTLSPKFARKRAADPVPVPAVPADLSARVERGREVYARIKCITCHGEHGAGDGPQAAELTDDRGLPIEPRNFTVQPFKYGETPTDIYRALVTGLDGTPMPSFETALKEDELWDVVAYVRTLIGDTTTAKVSARDIEEVRAFVKEQRQQANHAVAGGCGCQARQR
jgi:mono/diheme cytochrome c family protein